MITPRTVLIYNFAIAAIFVLVGVLSIVALEPLVSRPVVVPPFDAASHQAIHTESDIEKLRLRAAFYFELGRGLKEARYADTTVFFADLRKICFALGLAFALGGALSLLAMRSLRPK